MEDLNWTEIIVTLLGVAGVFVAGVPLILKRLAGVTKEVGELLMVITSALADGNISGDELRKIADEADDILPAIRAAITSKNANGNGTG